MKHLTYFLLLIIFICLTGCGPVVHYSKLSDDFLPPKPKDAPIEIFMSVTPTCSYNEIGIVSVSEGAFAGGMETFISSIKMIARKLGGDAIILGELGEKTSGYIAVAPGVIGVADSKTQTGIIIKFTDPDCIK